MSSIFEEISKYKFFNSSRYFILDILTQYVRPHYNAHIQGGLIMLNLFEGSMLDNIKYKIEEYIDNNPNVDYKFLLSLIYVNDINIITGSIDTAKLLANSIINSIKENSFRKYFFNYLFVSVCNYLNWKKDDVKYEIKLRMGKSSRDIDLYVENKILGINYTFEIVNIIVVDNYKQQNIKNIYDVYKYDVREYSKQVLHKYMTYKNQGINNINVYTHTELRNLARGFLYFNMFINKDIIAKNITNDNSNEAKTFITDFSNIFMLISKLIKNINIKVPIINKTNNSTFTIDFSNDAMNYYIKLKNNNIDNLILETIDYLEQESTKNIDSLTFQNNNILNNNLTNYVYDAILVKRSQPKVNRKLSSDDNYLQRIFDEYNNDLVKLDYEKVILRFSDNYYLGLNNYLTDRIYLNSNNINDILNTDLDIINDIIRKMSNKYNKELFRFDDELYVWRGEINRLIGENGSMYNLKKGDRIYTRTPISTSFHRPFVKDITLKIKIKEESKFAILLKNSKYIHEYEILLPYGTILDVTNTSYIKVNNNYTYLIEADYISSNNAYDVETHINNYKNIIYDSSYKPNLILATPSVNNLQLIPPVIGSSSNSISINMTLITNAMSTYELKNLDNLNINNPYIDFINKTKGIITIAKLPAFKSREAYIGEQINYFGLNVFCKKEDFIRLKTTKYNLNLLTFNVHNFVKICGTNQDAGRNVNYFTEYIRHINQYTNVDIICLQEIVPLYDSYPDSQDKLKEGSFKYLISTMKSYGYHYNTLVNANYDYYQFKEDYFLLANAIFSKIKPTKVFRYGLMGNRCAIVNTIPYDNNELNIINIHLEWDKYKVSSNHNKSYLDIQIIQLEQILNTHKNYILMGDFNTSVYNDNLFKNIRAKSQIISPKNIVGSFTGINNKKIIDYIIISNELIPLYDINQESDKILNDISDHYPVFASLIPKLNTKLSGSVNLNATLYKQLSKLILNIYKMSTTKETINIYFTNKYVSRSNINIFVVPNKYGNLSYPYYYYLPLTGNIEYVKDFVNMINELHIMGHTIVATKDKSTNIYDDIYDYLTNNNIIN